jgi:hypothetical protein
MDENTPNFKSSGKKFQIGNYWEDSTITMVSNIPDPQNPNPNDVLMDNISVTQTPIAIRDFMTDHDPDCFTSQNDTLPNPETYNHPSPSNQNSHPAPRPSPLLKPSEPFPPWHETADLSIIIRKKSVPQRFSTNNNYDCPTIDPKLPTIINDKNELEKLKKADNSQKTIIFLLGIENERLRRSCGEVLDSLKMCEGEISLLKEMLRGKEMSLIDKSNLDLDLSLLRNENSELKKLIKARQDQIESLKLSGLNLELDSRKLTKLQAESKNSAGILRDTITSNEILLEKNQGLEILVEKNKKFIEELLEKQRKEFMQLHQNQNANAGNNEKVSPLEAKISEYEKKFSAFESKLAEKNI